MTMRCIRVERIGDFDLTSTSIPSIGPNDVLVQVEVAGLCRTDLKLIRVGHRDLTLPRIPGEEVVGRVAAIGSGVINVTLGERVYLYPGVWCGTCAACRSGAENLCRSMRIMGFHRDGGMAEYVAVPAQSVLPVPATLQPEEAVFAEPLSCCLNALELGGTREGATVAIWGAGPAGTLLNRASRALGARPINIERDERRRALIEGVAVPPSQAV
ncbi:MAG TPA: alcohol dehydrogenase catalytic domain-containing protein, partial [Polyangiaceae bacterium]|nr:alcohol dehydrogenase catalytic domain-containing protein [Polyangiaceae bacterium]